MKPDPFTPLDDYEAELMELEASGKLESQALPASEHTKFEAAARRTLTKDKRINIRLTERDLQALRRRANRYGMPYQTLISSVLHRYAAGDLVTREGDNWSVAEP